MKVGYTFQSETDSSAVSSVSDRNRLNLQDKSRLETVVSSSLVPLTSLLMPFTIPKDTVVHLGGLIGMANGCL